MASLFAVVVDLFFIITKFSDGFAAVHVVHYHQNKYDAVGLEACVKNWMGVWVATTSRMREHLSYST